MYVELTWRSFFLFLWGSTVSCMLLTLWPIFKTFVPCIRSIKQALFSSHFVFLLSITLCYTQVFSSCLLISWSKSTLAVKISQFLILSPPKTFLNLHYIAINRSHHFDSFHKFFLLLSLSFLSFRLWLIDNECAYCMSCFWVEIWKGCPANLWWILFVFNIFFPPRRQGRPSQISKLFSSF